MAKTDKRRKSPRLPTQIDRAIAAAEDKQAVDLVVLDLRKAAGFTDFFLICSGTNKRQVRAIVRRRLRPLRMDSARLLRFHRPRLRARNARLLRSRAAMGKRGSHRGRGGEIAARGKSPAAFGRRCIPLHPTALENARRGPWPLVLPQILPDILGRRALPSGRLAGLGATPGLSPRAASD